MISETRILKGIVSSNENTPILHGETTVLGLMTALKDNSEDKEQSYSVDREPKSSARDQKTSAEGFNFSTVQVNKDNEVAQLDLPPYINFLKGRNSERMSCRKSKKNCLNLQIFPKNLCIEILQKNGFFLQKCDFTHKSNE